MHFCRRDQKRIGCKLLLPLSYQACVSVEDVIDAGLNLNIRARRARLRSHRRQSCF